MQAAGQARMDSFTTASAKRALGSLQSVRWTSDAPGFSNVRMHYAGRTGVCGNALCEVCSPTKAPFSNVFTASTNDPPVPNIAPRMCPVKGTCCSITRCSLRSTVGSI